MNKNCIYYIFENRLFKQNKKTGGTYEFVKCKWKDSAFNWGFFLTNDKCVNITDVITNMKWGTQKTYKLLNEDKKTK